MSKFIETLEQSAKPALEVITDNMDQDKKLWTPEGSAIVTDLSNFEKGITKMQDVVVDGPLNRIPVATNRSEINQQAGQYIGVATKDNLGKKGIFPGIILAPDHASQVKIGVLNSGPSKMPNGDTHPGDRLANDFKINGEQMFSLHQMITTEAEGVGIHGEDKKVSVADIAHGAVAFGLVVTPQWRGNAHSSVHAVNDAGLAKGLTQTAGLYSITHFTSQDTVLNPDFIYWHPNLSEATMPELPEELNGPNAVIALGYTALKMRVPENELKGKISAGIQAVQGH